MNKEIKSITLNFEDGTNAEIPLNLIDFIGKLLNNNQNIYPSLTLPMLSPKDVYCNSETSMTLK